MQQANIKLWWRFINFFVDGVCLTAYLNFASSSHIWPSFHKQNIPKKIELHLFFAPEIHFCNIFSHFWGFSTSFQLSRFCSSSDDYVSSWAFGILRIQNSLNYYWPHCSIYCFIHSILAKITPQSIWFRSFEWTSVAAEFYIYENENGKNNRKIHCRWHWFSA
jgi:hypothetical protein